MVKRRLKPDEQRAWARVAKTVRALPETPPIEVAASNRNAEDASEPLKNKVSVAETKRTAYQTVSPSPLSAPLSRRLPPVQNRGRERKIRRGQAQIAATLDLHGMTQDMAQTALTGFLKRQRAIGARCVLVITGKGRAGDGILRKRLLQWLGTGEISGLVNGYAEAHRKHGGSGAWYLFLRKL